MPMRNEKLKLSPDLAPWARQPGESSDDFLKFTAFLELGEDRTLEQAVETWNITNGEKKQASLSGFKKISALNRWTDRVAAYNALQWQQEHRRQVKLWKDARERRRKQGVALQAKGAQVLASIPNVAINSADALRLIVEGARMEAEAIGVPEQQHPAARAASGETQTLDTSGWTEQQIKAYMRDMAAEMAARSGAGVFDDDE